MPYPGSTFLDSELQTQVLTRRKPVFGLVALGLTLVCAVLVVLAPTRLVGLGLLVPLAAAVVYLWFRRREQTSGVLTLVTLGALGVTLGVGGALSLTGVRGETPTDMTPPVLSTSAEHQATGHPFIGPSAPARRPEAPDAQATPAMPVATPKDAAAKSPPAKPAQGKPAQDVPGSDVSGTDGSGPGAPARGGTEQSQAQTLPGAQPDPESDRSADQQDPNTAETTPRQRSQQTSCSLGQYRTNPDGTADVCMGGGSWQHARRNSRGDWEPDQANSDYGGYGGGAERGYGGY